MNLRLLRYFVSVAEDLSFTLAARRLHVSQPALSRQIRQLEQELNVELFDRHPRGVRLTDAGQLLFSQVTPLLQQWNRTSAALRAAAATEAASLRIGFTAANTTGLVRPAITEFGTRHPGWRVIMVQSHWYDPTAALRTGEVDVAFLRHPIPDADLLHQLVVHTEPRVLALPADHPLTRQPTIAFTDILNETFVPLPAGPWRDYWLCLDQRAGHDVRLTDPVSGPEEWSAAISAGRGMAVTAASAADYYARPGITFRPLTGVDSTVVSVVWRRDDNRDKVRQFLLACHTALKSDLPAADPRLFARHSTATPDPTSATSTRSPSQTTPALQTTTAQSPRRAAPADAGRLIRFAISSQPEPLQEGLLHAFRASADDTITTIHPTDSTSSRVDALLAGTADVAFARVTRSPHPDLGYQPLKTDRLLLALPRRRPLLATGSTTSALPLTKLDGLPLAFYHRDQNPWWYDEVMQLLDEHDVRPKIVHRGLWVYDLLPLVNAGDAAAFISTATAATVTLPGVSFARVRPAPILGLGLLWRHDIHLASLTILRNLAYALTDNGEEDPARPNETHEA